MKEYLDFRMPGRHANRIFGSELGFPLGPDPDDVRRFVFEVGDPNYNVIKKYHVKYLENQKKKFFKNIFHNQRVLFGWKFVRKYTDIEIQKSRLFSFWSTAYFEPCGEECGTQYNQAIACHLCGAGADQIGPLILKNSTIPKGKDFAITIGRENLISHRAAELFDQQNISGIKYGPVVLNSREGEKQSSDWYQMIINHTSAWINKRTLIGIDPFDFDIERTNVCPNGDTLGLNILSELYVDKETQPETDFCFTHQYIGGLKGDSLIPPHREILISPRVFRLAQENKLKGWEFEVAYLV